MRRVIPAILVLFLAVPITVAQEPPATFNAAKKLLADLHEEIDRLVTLYCGCDYERTTASGGEVDRDSCGLEARSNESRSKRVEWEHVVPASWFGNTRSCWKVGHELCVKTNGTKFKGRDCCTKTGVNPDFKVAHNDPNNLFPSSGEVNGDRSAHPYGKVTGEKRKYGDCDFELGGSPKRAEPADEVRGIIARAMLYMSDVYGVNVQFKLATLVQWNKDHPPEQWEVTRAEKIAEKTGRRNQWILGDE